MLEKKSYGELYSKWFPSGVFKDHSNMVTEITLREAYEMKEFVILIGPRRGRHGRLSRVNYISGLQKKKKMNNIWYLFTKSKNRLNY